MCITGSDRFVDMCATTAVCRCNTSHQNCPSICYINTVFDNNSTPAQSHAKIKARLLHRTVHHQSALLISVYVALNSIELSYSSSYDSLPACMLKMGGNKSSPAQLLQLLGGGSCSCCVLACNLEVCALSAALHGYILLSLHYTNYSTSVLMGWNGVKGSIL